MWHRAFCTLKEHISNGADVRGLVGSAMRAELSMAQSLLQDFYCDPGGKMRDAGMAFSQY
jgi:hypothetical protein